MGQYFASLAYGNYIELPHVLNILFAWKGNFKKNKVLQIDKFPSLILLRDVIMCILLSIAYSIICQVVAYSWWKTDWGKFQTFIPTSGRGHLWEVVP